MKALPPKGTIGLLQAWNLIVLGIIILRFWIRRCKLRIPKSSASIAADVQIVLAWLLITVCQGLTFSGLVDLIHYSDAPSPDPLKHPLLQPKFHKINFGMVLGYFTVLWLVKGAFIAFFFDLFPRHGLNKKLRLALYGTVIYTVAGYIASVLIHLLLCRPIQTAWIAGPRNCNSSLLNPATLTATTVINITTDLMLMILPITILRRTLSFRRRESIALTLVFLVGLTTVICALIRYAVVRGSYPSDLESTGGKVNDISVIQVWSFIEVYFAIITFCLPAFRVLLRNRSPRNPLPHYEQGMRGCGTLERSHLRKGRQNKPDLSSVASIARGGIGASDLREHIDNYNNVNLERGHMSEVGGVDTSDFSSNQAMLPLTSYEKRVGVLSHKVCITPPYTPL